MENLQISIGRMEHELHTLRNKDCDSKRTPITDFEMKVFSQWGEDGIIQYLVDKVQPESKRFIEFGVENFQESNCRYLLVNNNWSGLIIDGSEKNIGFVKKQPYFWQRELTAVNAFITRENINELIKNGGFTGQVGILSIDVDGNDYWIWESINVVDPDIVIVEFNSLFGPHQDVAIPYQSDFQRYSGHHSGMYYGASITAFTRLAEQKGYVLVGTNLVGCNLFYVKKSKALGLPNLSPFDAFRKSKFRDDKSDSGEMLFGNYEQRRQHLKGLPIWDFKSGRVKEFQPDSIT